ncbi:hypothetical protein QUB47_06935 [Microcoleus sp. AT9_B5]
MVAVFEVVERYCSTESAIFVKVDRAIASMILEELQEALKCDRAFSRSPDALAKLAATTTHAKNNRMSFILRNFYVERDS